MENLEAYCKQFETHKATLVQNSDRYTVIDWRRERMAAVITMSIT